MTDREAEHNLRLTEIIGEQGQGAKQQSRRIMLHVACLDAAPDRAQTARERGDAVDRAVDHPRIDELGKETRARRKRPDKNVIVNLIDVIFVERKPIEQAAR